MNRLGGGVYRSLTPDSERWVMDADALPTAPPVSMAEYNHGVDVRSQTDNVDVGIPGWTTALGWHHPCGRPGYLTHHTALVTATQRHGGRSTPTYLPDACSACVTVGDVT